MTDKELIKQEIERRIKNLEFSLENNCVEKHSKLDILGNITTLESLLQFIEPLQETKKTGVELIADERQRQIEKEGWTPEHDIFEHRHGQLIDAAVSYALTEEERKQLCHLTKTDEEVPPTWPFEKEYWKPCPNDRIKELVKAGALIAEEIDRLLNLKKRT